MRYFFLKHKRALKYSAAEDLPPFPEGILSNFSSEITVISFRPPPSALPKNQIIAVKDITAIDRFLNYADAEVLFWHLSDDSPLHPLIFWDVAHASPVNATFYVKESGLTNFFEKKYYSDQLRPVDFGAELSCYKKCNKLLAENDCGLTDWTFGIVTGPGDASKLNIVVKKILDLKLPTFEIIICGQPGENFKYLNQVKVIGENIPAPPIRITKKKNLIFQNAQYGNVCVLHDRVAFASNFLEAVTRHGDFYPLSTFQSIYFLDKFNIAPCRYSDIGFPTAYDPVIFSYNVTLDELSPFSPTLNPYIESFNFCYANPLRHEPHQYPTGSLYICKKSVWNFCQQNEELFWCDFEDVEFGIRMAHNGIPSKINPYSLTQSITARPLLLGIGGSVFFCTDEGKTVSRKSFLNIFGIFPKPLYEVTLDEAQQKLNRFCQHYKIPTMNVAQNSFKKLDLMLRILRLIKISPVRKMVSKFIDDYFNLILHDQLTPGEKEAVLRAAMHMDFPKVNKVIINRFIYHITLHPYGKIYPNSANDLLAHPLAATRFFSFLSAVAMRLFKPELASIRLPLKELANAIHSSTPITTDL